jgi:hypothetical protein
VEHSVKRAGRAIELTPKEFGLLEYLMRNAGQRVTRAQIIEHVRNLSFDTMFAFFVVLYSSAQIDKRKAGQLAMAIQVAFQQMGICDAASSKVALAGADPTPIADVQIIKNVKRLQNLGQLPSPAQGPAAGSVDRPKMDELQKKLEDALSLQIDNRIISVAPNQEGIVMSLREADFFQSGSTQLAPQTIPALASIVKIIGPEKMDIRIEGTPIMFPFTMENTIRTGSYPPRAPPKSSSSSSLNSRWLPIAFPVPVTANTIPPPRTIPPKAAP